MYIGIIACVVGLAVSWSIDIFRRVLVLFQFLINSYETWQKCFLCDVNMQETFSTAAQSVLTANYGQKWREIFCRILLHKFLIIFMFFFVFLGPPNFIVGPPKNKN